MRLCVHGCGLVEPVETVTEVMRWPGDPDHDVVRTRRVEWCPTCDRHLARRNASPARRATPVAGDAPPSAMGRRIGLALIRLVVAWWLLRRWFGW